MEALRRPGTIKESLRSCTCVTCLGSTRAGLLVVASSGRTNVHSGLQDDETLSLPSQLVLGGPARTSVVESVLGAAAVDQRPISPSIESFVSLVRSVGAQSSSSQTFLKRSFKLCVDMLNVVPPLLDPLLLLSEE